MLQEILIEIDAKISRLGLHTICRLAELTGPRSLFQAILATIDDRQQRPVPGGAQESGRNMILTGEVRSDDDKIGYSVFQRRPNHEAEIFCMTV